MTLVAGIGHNRSRSRQRVYAITFDFDGQRLEQLCHNEHRQNAHADVRKFLESSGFDNKQRPVYFALDEIDATDCIAVVQDLAEEYDWFVPALRGIRMLRIEENNDSMTVLDRTRRRRRPV